MTRVQFEFALDGGGNNPPPSPRAGMDLFVGLRPSDTASRLSTDIAEDFMRRFDVSEAVRPLHVTLSALGRHSRLSTLELAAKMEELSSVAVKPFMLVFDQIMSFDRHADKKALVLCCRQPNRSLLELQRRIIDVQKPPGIEDETRQAFTPHMTLFYTHQTVLRQPLKTPVEWCVRDFHILRSHIGECRHESMWHWPPSE